MTVSAGAGWCTHFSGTRRVLRHRRLRYAYRAPSFFADEWLRGGNRIEFLRFDESVDACDFDGTQAALAEHVDVLYIATHGSNNAAGYRTILHGSDWEPALGGFGPNGPSVVIFDTCDLVSLSNRNWNVPWEVPTVGRALRLVLGFSTPATVGQATSVRGRGFVQNLLAGDTFVDAWMGCIVGTSYQGTDQPVAIAFGDSATDARTVLVSARLNNIPGARGNTIPTTLRYP